MNETLDHDARRTSRNGTRNDGIGSSVWVTESKANRKPNAPTIRGLT
jgi:hypothetical protein